MINYKILRNFVFKIYAYVIRSIIKKALSKEDQKEYFDFNAL